MKPGRQAADQTGQAGKDTRHDCKTKSHSRQAENTPGRRGGMKGKGECGRHLGSRRIRLPPHLTTWVAVFLPASVPRSAANNSRGRTTTPTSATLPRWRGDAPTFLSCPPCRFQQTRRKAAASPAEPNTRVPLQRQKDHTRDEAPTGSSLSLFAGLWVFQTPGAAAKKTNAETLEKTQRKLRAGKKNTRLASVRSGIFVFAVQPVASRQIVNERLAGLWSRTWQT